MAAEALVDSGFEFIDTPENYDEYTPTVFGVVVGYTDLEGSWLLARINAIVKPFRGESGWCCFPNAPLSNDERIYGRRLVTH
jgi:hypothetical protein